MVAALVSCADERRGDAGGGIGVVPRRLSVGDRRNRYVAKTDPWDIVRTIIDERKKREIDPSLELLRTVSATANADNETPTDVAWQPWSGRAFAR